MRLAVRQSPLEPGSSSSPLRLLLQFQRQDPALDRPARGFPVGRLANPFHILCTVPLLLTAHAALRVRQHRHHLRAMPFAHTFAPALHPRAGYGPQQFGAVR